MPAKLLLVAEDDEIDALILERALRRAGVNLRMARVADGEQLVAYLKGEGAFANRDVHPVPDLVLLDLKMPKMDGFDVLRWRQRSGLVPRLPVIVFSSSGLERDIRDAYALGANSYVVKPLRSDALDGMVRALHEWWTRFNVTSANALA